MCGRNFFIGFLGLEMIDFVFQRLICCPIFWLSISKTGVLQHSSTTRTPLIATHLTLPTSPRPTFWSSGRTKWETCSKKWTGWAARATISHSPTFPTGEKYFPTSLFVCHPRYLFHKNIYLVSNLVGVLHSIDDIYKTSWPISKEFSIFEPWEKARRPKTEREFRKEPRKYPYQKIFNQWMAMFRQQANSGERIEPKF